MMEDRERREKAIGALADALADAPHVTMQRSKDGLGIHFSWAGGRGMVVRTKRIKTADGPELWYVEPPGSLVAETRHVDSAARMIRELAGERVR